jgi:glycosyltransferase involved in cell wall biosynthesis
MPEPKVSVIILTYNRVDMIQKCVKSVLGQTFRDYQILIIDDGSTDDTRLSLSGIKDPRLTVKEVKHSGHISKLRNLGIQNTSGKFIAFLDSDDQWDKDHLYTQVNFLEKDGTQGFVSSDIEVYDDRDLLFKGAYGSAVSGLLKGNFFQKVISGQIILPTASALLFRRDCLKRTGLLNEKFLTGDFEFLCRLVYHFKGTRCFDPPVRINRHSDNHSDIWESECFREVLLTLSQFYEDNKISKDMYKKRCFELHYKLASKYWQRQKYIRALSEYFRSFKFKPVNGRTIIRNIRRLVS